MEEEVSENSSGDIPETKKAKLSHLPETQRQEIEDLLEKNADLFAKNDCELGKTHLVNCKIDTRGDQSSSRSARLDSRAAVPFRVGANYPPSFLSAILLFWTLLYEQYIFTRLWHMDREVRVTTSERDNERKYKDEHNAYYAVQNYHGIIRRNELSSLQTPVLGRPSLTWKNNS